MNLNPVNYYSTYASVLVSILFLVLFCNSVPGQQSERLPLFPVSIDGKAGFIDRIGKIQIEPQFAEAENFAGGFARVRVRDSKTSFLQEGFIDSTGKLIIPARFTEVYDFSESLALAKDDKGLYGFIDTQGAWAIKPLFDDAHGTGFADGKRPSR